MKDLDQIDLPEDCRYAESHEWVKSEGDQIKVGISDYAQDQLGDIIFVDLPQAGDSFQKGDEFGTIESVKAVSDLFIPISGEIVAVNAALEDTPEVVNTSPYEEGWMIDIKPSDLSEMDGLLTKAAYLEVLKEIE